MGGMRTWSCVGWILAVTLLGSCTSEPANSRRGKPVLVINDLNLTAEDLRREIERAPVEPALPSPEGEPEWLTRVIERELIVQEGRRMGLDREPEFMRSIERFWKEALLKQVLRRKAREISSQVQLYEPAVRQQKEADAMEEWMAGLRQHAKIEVDRQALEKIR